MQSEWRDIAGYEGLYQISSNGEILNVKSNYIKKPFINKRIGYELCSLYKDSVGTSFLTHRLVAKAFHPNPENKPDVNHKNKVKTDNRAENLEWVTKSENQKHAFQTIDVSGENHNQAKLTDADVMYVRQMYRNGIDKRELPSIFQVSYALIYDLIKNRRRVLA